MNHHSRARKFQVGFVLLLFTLAGTWRYRKAVGEDLSSSYVGCRLIAAGQADHLYAHDPAVFSTVRDPVWNAVAEQARFAPLGLLHPYVQTPLWAYLLQPACTRTTFRTFRHLFLFLAMLCMSGTIWLVARYWATSLFHPAAVFLICVAIAFFDPFRYAMFLTQTHILFVFLSILALLLAQRGRPGWAGLVLSVAAAVKVTPALLLIYWLVARRYKAALSFVLFSLLLVILTVGACGSALFVAYLHELSWVSNVLLVAYNNQSLAAWWLGRYYPSSELFDWRIHALPSAMKWVSLLLALGSAAAGGWMDRIRSEKDRDQAPYGAAFALVGATMFSALAWNHYYVLLAFPLLLLLQTAWQRRSWLWGGFAAVIYVLNVYPIAYGSSAHVYKHYSLVRSEFYSGAFCLLAILLMALRKTGTATAN